MFAALSITLASLSLVSALAVPRTTTPAGWWTAGLEPYAQYHDRYMELGCFSQHNSSFFDTCCHPLLKSESLSSRPAECDPSNDCDDDDDEPQSSSGVSASSSSATPVVPSSAASTQTSAPINVAPDPVQAPPATTTTHHTTSHTTAQPSKTTSHTSATPAATQSSGNVLTGEGRGTFFFQNGVAGACGTVHADTDKVVALDTATYQNGKFCGKTITITNSNNGKSVTAVVADECPTCETSQSCDMSVGAFTEIATESEGDVPITWTMHL